MIKFPGFFQGTKNVGVLTKNPFSIEDIVVKQYRAIKSRMVVISNFDDSKIKVDLKSDCKKPGSRTKHFVFFNLKLKLMRLFDSYFF